MIEKIINKMVFLKKTPRNFTKLILNFFIIFDEFFWKLRVNYFLIFSKKKNQLHYVFKELKNNGYAIFERFYDEKTTNIIKENCLNEINNLPANKISNIETISNLILPNGLRLEKLNESIKLKGLNKLNPFFSNITNNYFFKKICWIYQLNLDSTLIYNLVHDGSFKHSIFSDKISKKMIAGQPHIDNGIHGLRLALALEDIDANNGPTVIFKGSMKMKKIKKNHTNVLLESFGFISDKESGHNLNEKDIEYLEQNCEKTEIICKKGDLVLIDLKSAHYQQILKKGQRHILWRYC